MDRLQQTFTVSVYTYQTTYQQTVQDAGTSGVTAQDDNFGIILAGQMEAVATAEQINKVENYRDPDSFADIVRGMHLYGRKILRPQALVSANTTLLNHKINLEAASVASSCI